MWQVLILHIEKELKTKIVLPLIFGSQSPSILIWICVFLQGLSVEKSFYLILSL